MSKQKTMTIYTECNIDPASAGFGMWQRGELQISSETSFANDCDLIMVIAENCDAVEDIEEALKDDDFIAAGVEDIRGKIYNEPGRILVILDNGELRYIGIEESEVEKDFF